MSFFSDLLDKPANLSTASKYAAMNGFIYLAFGGLLIFWPGAVQTIFMDAPFAGKEEALFRVLGMTLSRHWMALLIRRPFGRSTVRPASVLDR